MNIFYRSLLYLFVLLLANQLKAQNQLQSNGKEIALEEVKKSPQKKSEESANKLKS